MVAGSASVTISKDAVRVTINKNDLPLLRDIKSLQGVEVTLNESTTEPRKFSWGKIYAPDLLLEPELEIQEHLADINGMDIELVKRQMKGEFRDPTPILKIKFELPYVPHSIKCLGKEYPVEKYFPPPSRCAKCQMFGHWKNRCRGPTRCVNCGQSHGELACTNLPSCYNCHGSHPASDPNCPRFRQEKDIILLSYENDIPFAEARNLFKNGTRPTNELSKPKPPVYENPYVTTAKIQTFDCNTDHDIKIDTLHINVIQTDGTEKILTPTPPSPPSPSTENHDGEDFPWNPQLSNPAEMVIAISAMNTKMIQRVAFLDHNEQTENFKKFTSRLNGALAAVYRTISLQDPPPKIPFLIPKVI